MPDQSEQRIPLVDTTEQQPSVKIFETESKKIYPRKIQGFYQRLRRYTGIPLLLGFLLMPWLTIDNRPAIFFDLSEQKFHIFWMSFWPQDGVLLAWLLILAAFVLFAVTVLVGRIWCGFTCPQTVWTLIYIWIEDKIEGDRNQRMKLDKQAWSLNKFIKRFAKHSLWLLVALITGLTFIGYFYEIKPLIVDLFTFNQAAESLAEAYFWVSLFTILTYLNAGFLREQVCKHMCPYARFQSVMYDEDTLLVSYDVARGEPRTKKKQKDPFAQAQGDCVDCSWCVQVCPVDIDIRDGLQYECIDCGLCIDACDQVMEKIGKPKGLIRFTSERALDESTKDSSGKVRFLRPRMIGYSVAVILMIGLFANTLITRPAVTVDIIKERTGQLYSERRGYIENTYLIKINNMSKHDDTYQITAMGKNNYLIDGNDELSVASGETFSMQLTLKANADNIKASRDTVEVKIISIKDPDIEYVSESSFIAPR